MKPIRPVNAFQRWLGSDQVVLVGCLLAFTCGLALA
jgi:hypothetical protein